MAGYRYDGHDGHQALPFLILVALTFFCSFRVDAAAGDQSCFKLRLKAFFIEKLDDAADYRGPWPVDGKKGGELYDVSFAPVLGGKTFDGILAERRKFAKPTNVLDIFGSALFLKRPSEVDSLTGVRLGHLPREYLPAGPPLDNWNEVDGNIYQRQTWLELQRVMKARGFEGSGFDLIVIRPVGGVSMPAGFEYEKGWIEDFRATHHLLLQRAYMLLSPDGGQMFVEMSKKAIDVEMLQGWLKLLHEANIPCEFGEARTWGYSLKITRNPDSEGRLP